MSAETLIEEIRMSNPDLQKKLKFINEQIRNRNACIKEDRLERKIKGD